MHFDGRSVPQDLALVHKWLNLVAALPHLSSEMTRSLSTQLATVTKKMPPARIANAQKSAREWKPTL